MLAWPTHTTFLLKFSSSLFLLFRTGKPMLSHLSRGRLKYSAKKSKRLLKLLSCKSPEGCWNRFVDLLKFGESDNLFTLCSWFIDDRPTAFAQPEKGKYNSDEMDLTKKLRLLNILLPAMFLWSISNLSLSTLNWRGPLTNVALTLVYREWDCHDRGNRLF